MFVCDDVINFSCNYNLLAYINKNNELYIIGEYKFKIFETPLLLYGNIINVKGGGNNISF